MARPHGKTEIREAGELRGPSEFVNVTTRRQSESRREDKVGACGRGAEDNSAYLSAVTEQLVSVVAEEAEHCERLLGLMRHQQALLIQGNTRKIESNVRDLEAAVRRSRYLDCRRRQLATAFAKNSTLNVGAPNLAQIIATVSDDYGSRLASLRTSMQMSIERLQDTKERNRALIEKSLSLINEFICSTQTGGGHRGRR